MHPLSEARMKMWIDAASYEELLSRWRHVPSGSVWFQGDMGEYYKRKMAERRDALTHDERVEINKRVGW